MYIPNTLIDLGAAINMMNLKTMRELNILNIRPTPIMLELADRSKIKLEGALDDEMVSIESWEYPFDFFILQPKSASGGHPIILGRPRLTTTNAFIGCKSGTIYISRGELVKQIKLYPPAQPKIETQNILWYDNEASDIETTQPIFTVEQFKSFQETSEENQISTFLCNANSLEQDNSEMERILNPKTQETNNPTTLTALHSLAGNTLRSSETSTLPIEISPNKFLHINPDLDEQQKADMIHILQQQEKSFSWDYQDMKGIQPKTCSHHIYTRADIRLVR
jgi:ASC-1-like (ASCH) protein